MRTHGTAVIYIQSYMYSMYTPFIDQLRIIVYIINLLIMIIVYISKKHRCPIRLLFTAWFELRHGVCTYGDILIVASYAYAWRVSW